MKRLILIGLIIINFSYLKSQTNNWDVVEGMGRGINLGNTLSAPIEGNWAPVVFQQFFVDVANEGFSNIRIPIDFFGDRTNGDTSSWSEFENTADEFNGLITDFTVDNSYMDRIETVVNWSLGQDLYTIIDIHGAQLKAEFLETFNIDNPNYSHPTSAKRQADLMKFKAIWIQIANRFINHPMSLIFEVVNEPYFEVSADEMDEINLMIIEAIRSTGGNNSARPIIITGGTLNSYEAPMAIGEEVLNSDSNLIASFHYYLPFNFTSSSSSNNNNYNWGSTSDKTTVNNHFNSVKTWSETNNIPITLGEFGADNEGGYNYQTGVYGDNGGPVNSDRVEYHRYISEQAINRGFSFSAWCSGNKSNKTIHLRTDNPTTLNTFNGIWVEDVKDALLADGAWPLCYGPTSDQIILNPDFECEISSSWNLTTLGSAVATFSESSTSVYSGNSSARIEVTTADEFNKVLLSNIDYQQDLTNKKVTIGCYAKSPTLGKSFKLRIKSKVNNSNAYTYNASPTFSLTSSYNYYSFEYIVPQNTTNLQIQVLMGEDIGIYFLDAFEILVEDFILATNTPIYNQNINIYPNPFADYLTIQSNKEITSILIYDINGRLIKESRSLKQFETNYLKKGVYFLEIKCFPNKIYYKKIIKI